MNITGINSFQSFNKNRFSLQNNANKTVNFGYDVEREKAKFRQRFLDEALVDSSGLDLSSMITNYSERKGFKVLTDVSYEIYPQNIILEQIIPNSCCSVTQGLKKDKITTEKPVEIDYSTLSSCNKHVIHIASMHNDEVYTEIILFGNPNETYQKTKEFNFDYIGIFDEDNKIHIFGKDCLPIAEKNLKTLPKLWLEYTQKN